MSIFDYVPLMKDIGTETANIGVYILCFFLLSVFLRMLSGSSRGTLRQLVRTGMTFGAAVIAYIAADSFSEALIGGLDQNSVGALTGYINTVAPELGDIADKLMSILSLDIAERVLLLPASIVIVPLSFTVIFVLLKMILSMIGAILCKAFKFNKASTGGQKLGGAILAAVEAAIYFVAVLFPFTGVIGIMEESYEAAIVDDQGNTDYELMNKYTTTLLPITENPAIKFFENIGADALSTHFATIKIGGQKSNLRKDVVPIVQLFLSSNGESINFKNLTGKDKTVINRILGAMEDSPYISELVSGLVRSSVSMLEKGGLINLGDADSEITGALFDFLRGFSAEHISEDVGTVRDIYFLLSDSGILSEITEGDGDLMTALGNHHEDGTDTVSTLVNILQSNPRTAPIVKALTQMLIKNLTDFNIDGIPSISYDNLKEDVEKVLEVKPEKYSTVEEYKQALTTVLDSALIDNGIRLHDDIVDTIADYIDEHFSEIEELSDEDFNRILLHYYEAYREYISGK